MSVENVPFEKITQSLASLSETELLDLERLAWNIHKNTSSNPTFEQMRVSASATFSSMPDEAPLAFDVLKDAISRLNPAEVNVVDTLITWHLDKSQSHEGWKASSTWGTNDPAFRFASNSTIMRGDFSAKSPVSPELEAEKLKAFKEYTQLISEVSAAKEAGDMQRAETLMKELIDGAKQMGFPDYMIEKLRELYP